MTCRIAVAAGYVCQAEPTPRMREIAARLEAYWAGDTERFRREAALDVDYLLRALGVRV